MELVVVSELVVARVSPGAGGLRKISSSAQTEGGRGLGEVGVGADYSSRI